MGRLRDIAELIRCGPPPDRSALKAHLSPASTRSQANGNRSLAKHQRPVAVVTFSGDSFNVEKPSYPRHG
jgi:hypothetical protein